MSGGWSEVSEAASTDGEKRRLDLLVGAVSGLIAGMAAFTYANFPAGVGIERELAAVLMIVAGGLGASFTDTLRRSTVVFFVGWSVGAVVLVLSLVVPAYYFPYTQVAQNVLVSLMARDALGWIVMVYSPAYVGAYFVALIAIAVTR